MLHRRLITAPAATRRRPSAPPMRRLKPALTGDTETGTLSGYGSIFGALDDHGTITMPGCFTASLEKHRAAGTMPKMLWQHDPTVPIGTWPSLAEDATGLLCSGQLLLDVDKAREAHALLKASAIDGLSIGFDLPEGYTEISEDEAIDLGIDVSSGYRLDNGMIGLLEVVDLWEISLVTFQSCPDAVVDEVRARHDPHLAELSAALAERARAVTQLLRLAHR